MEETLLVKCECTSTVLRQKHSPWYGSTRGLQCQKLQTDSDFVSGRAWCASAGYLLLKQLVLLRVRPLLIKQINCKRPQMSDKRVMSMYDNVRLNTTRDKVNLLERLG